MRKREPGRRIPLAAALRWVGLGIRAVVGTPARAVRGTARLVADPTRQVIDYWASEQRTTRQAFTAVSIASLTSLIAGVTLAGMDHRLASVKGLFVLIPVSIGMRGNIFGALAARLGTSIHSGLFEVSRAKEGLLYQNVYAATLLTIATSVAMGVLARAISSLLGIDTVSVWDFMVIALVGGILSSAVVLAVTVVLSIVSFRRGWDLDSVGAPLITAIGDTVTLPCLLLASYLIDLGPVTPVLSGVSLVLGVVALGHGWVVDSRLTRQIVRESFPVLCVAIVLDVLAGTVVEPRIEETFLTFPALLILVPGFLENTGALGSKLHLGAVTARARPQPAALLDGTIILALGILIYVLLGTSTLALATILNQDYPGVLRFIGITLTGGMLATLVAGVIGYYAAVTTHRFGFDPDNHTIPLVTSGMDLTGVICLVVSLVIFGVA